MKIIVCGAGLVGFGIARHLAAEGNDVTVVDREAELIQRINDTLDVRAIQGHGAHPSVLDNAGARNADIIIAVTSSDEVNMVICQIAYSLFKVPKKIARIRDHKYLEKEWAGIFSHDDLPVDEIISPEEEVAESVLQRLAIPGAYDSANFVGGKQKFLAMNLTENCPVVDTPLNQLTELFSDLKAVVVGIKRNGKIIVPKNDHVMMIGDDVFLVTDEQDAERTMTIFGHEEKEAAKIILVGAGNVGSYVARKLEQRGSTYSVRVIENDRERAKIVADELDRTIVLQGNGLESELLYEAGVRDAGLLVALTNDDQVNILVSLLARNEGCERALCLINDTTFLPISKTIGLDAAINPRSTTVSSVLSHIRRGRVKNVHTVDDGAAEVIEAEVADNSPLVGKKIRQLDLRDNVRIGSIYRNGETVVPRGNTEIKSDDRIVVFAMTESVDEVEKLFHSVLEKY
ncbi:MAG: Trk system potassium transporter TrkA [Parvibaculales bacterium]